MKRFAVFAGDHYYPAGGMYDFKKSFNTQEEAELYKEELLSREGKGMFFSPPDWVVIEDMNSYE
jgi:hypothetical protein